MDASIEREEASISKQENGGVKIARNMVMIVLIAVMLGYLFMWISMPTDIYRDEWRHTIGDSIKSTYFGKQGLLLLMYVFPALFVATLGSVYLHLGKKYLSHEIPRKEEKSTGWLATWRRPVVVRGPLGIVSGIELSFLLMFIALLVWSFTTYLQGYYAKIEVEDGEKGWLYKWGETVFVFGKTGNICLTLLFYPVTRGSSILPFLGLTSESSIKYHMWLGHLTLTLATCHGLGFILFWAMSGEMSQALEWNKTDVAHLAGEITLFFGLIIWIGTFPRIRRKLFEVFYYTHNLYIIFVIFFFFHVGNRFAYYMLPGFYLFLIDRYLRFLQSRQSVRLLSARVLPCEALELNFAKSTNINYNSNSIMFVNIPCISKIQWHPFTITSSSNIDEHKLSVVIKVEGKWTRKLYDTLSSPSSVDHLQFSVEGPYGPTSNHFLRHETLVLVSGGSGITPFISIIQELLFVSTTLKCKTPKVVLISAFKKSCDLSLLNLLLPNSGTSCDLSSLDIQIKAYVTREEGQGSEDYLKQSPRTICFKPNESDTPIYPTLGNNSWLWLGAIIASSFMGYLIFMGLLTQYYIYPIDQDTAEIFNWSTTTVYYFLIICGCIGMTASGAFLWNKKQNSAETKQITNMEGLTPQATPGSQLHNADRELESLPRQSILNSTQVHYGQRPDLKRLLFDCKGSSTGVLASGPPGLRHEVALICGAGLVENLYFESISFSW